MECEEMKAMGCEEMKLCGKNNNVVRRGKD
jgi:hypothetical protein